MAELACVRGCWDCLECNVNDGCTPAEESNLCSLFFEGFGLVKLDVKTKSCSGVVSDCGFPMSL